ncbi:MAG: Periplasmic zinc-binding protein TroA precursor [Planctomycetota bacterium]
MTTTSLVGDLVRNIAGPDLAIVESLMGEGVDPHLYKGSPRDVRNLASAEMIFAGGLHLEGKLVSVLHRLSHQKNICLLGEQLSESCRNEGENEPWIFDSGVADPHYWFDVQIWNRMSQLVAEKFSGFLPEQSSVFLEAAGHYKTRLDTLEQEIRAELAKIPEEHRILITSHDAFRYFGRAYDITVEGIQGLSTESEAGIRRTNQLVDLVVSRRIPSIFVETSVSDDNVKALVEGARARGHQLQIGGSLFSDAPGADGTPEGTYIGMMRHNLLVFTKAMTNNDLQRTNQTA